MYNWTGMESEDIRRIPYFTSLDGEALERIRPLVGERVYKRNQVIMVEGEPCEALFFVLRGRVMILKTSQEGREQVLRVMLPGEAFNEVPIFDGGPNPATAQAAEESTLLAVRKPDMDRILRAYPHLMVNILMTFATRLRELTNLVSDLSFRHVTSRLAKLLLKYGEGSGDRPTYLTQQEMAAMVGTVREVVSRSLRVLEDEGAIRLDRNRVVVLDRDALEAMV